MWHLSVSTIMLVLFTSFQYVITKNCPTSESARKRLDPKWLDLSCEKKDNWTTTAKLGSNKVLDDILSPPQLKFLKDIQACDVVCLCKAFPVCKDFLDQVTNTFNTISDTFKSQTSSIMNTDALNNLLTNPDRIKSVLKPDSNGLQNILNPTALQTILANNPLSGLLDPSKNGLGNVFNPSNFQNILGANGKDLLGGLFGRRKVRQAEPKEIGVKPVVRKEYRMMSEEERYKFHSALNSLKFTKIDGMSKYNLLTVYHTAEYSPEAHFGAAFLPFHRELLKQFETALRLIDINLFLPYWDSSLDEGLPAPVDSILWSDEFLGNGNGDVTTGPFQNWTVQPDTHFDITEPGHKIIRAVGQSPFGSLMRPEDRTALLSRTSFRQLVYCTDPFFELLHGAQHMYVGGHMAELTISPNDPTFYLHHANVDRLWEDWRQLRQSKVLRETEYVEDKDSCNNFARANDSMKPFTLKNHDGLMNNYTDLYYHYDPSPSCSKSQTDCGSPYVFCDIRNYRCLSKVVPKGNCKGFEGTDICYRGKCVKGKCVASLDYKTTVKPTSTSQQQKITITTVTTTNTTTRPPELTTKATPNTTKSTVTTATKTTTTTKPSVTTTFATKQITSTTKTTTQKKLPPTLKPPPTTVWVPITVVQLLDGKTVKSPASTVFSKDVDTGAILKGEIPDREEFPYYTGVAFIQLSNPRLKPNGTTIAFVSVNDSAGNSCPAQCYSGLETHDYQPCNGSLTLDVSGNDNPQNHIGVSSNNVSFTDKRETATYLNWKGPVRRATVLLFVCNTYNETEKANGSSVEAVIAETSNTTSDEMVSTKDETCTDEDRCCRYWSTVGECKRNPVWMKESCQLSCEVCNRPKSSKKCQNNFVMCSTWAASGECKKNPDWMEENCRVACKTCSRAVADLGVLCGAPTLKDCEDTDAKCSKWAKDHQCEDNAWWMSKNCPLSCGKCTAKST